MSEVYVDVNERMVWSRSKLHRIRFSVAVAGAVAGVVIALLADNTKELILGWGSAAIAFPWALYEIYWWFHPNSSLIELLPQGVIFRTTTEHFIVPWNEVKAVDSIDVETAFRGRPVTFHNVTVLLVTQFFYDRVIHVDSFIMRGPGWDANFIPKGNMMQVAIHHEILPNATAEEVRRQVEERWKAFGSVRSGATEAQPT